MTIKPRGEARTRKRSNHRDGEKAVMSPKIVGFVNAQGNADQKTDRAGDSIGPACTLADQIPELSPLHAILGLSLISLLRPLPRPAQFPSAPLQSHRGFPSASQ